MYLKINCKIKLGNDAAQTAQDVKDDVLEVIGGLFEDIAFTSPSDEVETSGTVIDHNGNWIGTVILKTTKGEK